MTPEQAQHQFLRNQEMWIRIYETASERVGAFSLEEFEKHLPGHHVNDFYKIVDAVTDIVAEDIFNEERGN